MVDVLVIGAGPAGSAAARLLAAWGHRVLLIHRAGGEAERFAESIPPSTRRVLAEVGALSSVDEAGFIPWRGNTVWWGSPEPRVETFAAGAAGYQAPRVRFDACLRACAVDAGAALVAGAVRSVRIPSLGEPTDDARPRVDVETDGQRVTFAPAIVIDASGRTGVVARRGLRAQDTEARTVALAARWRATGGWGLIDETHTLVASYEDGWAWSVPIDGEARLFTVMIDPRRTRRLRDAASREVYLAELAKVGPFRPVLDRGAIEGDPWGADASPYHATRYSGADFLLAGDAATFIDPLSSFGVKKALASGWLAAVVANTILARPTMATAACALFDRREAAMHRFAVRQAADLASDAAGGVSHPFWLARAAVTTDADPEAADADLAAVAAEPAVRAAFEALKRQPSLALRRGNVTLTLRPLVRSRQIVTEDHVVLPRWPEGVRYLRNIDVLEVLSLAPLHQDVGRLYEAVRLARAGIELPDFLGVLAVLVAEGALTTSVV